MAHTLDYKYRLFFSNISVRRHRTKYVYHSAALTTSKFISKDLLKYNDQSSFKKPEAILKFMLYIKKYIYLIHIDLPYRQGGEREDTHTHTHSVRDK